MPSTTKKKTASAEQAAAISAAGRRRPAMASTEVSPEAIEKLQKELKMELVRFQTPYDNYSCSECGKNFPWNTVMYGNRENDYDISVRCINKKYPAPGTLVVRKNVEARKADLRTSQSVEAAGSSLDSGAPNPAASKMRTTSMTREQFALSTASPEERRKLKKEQRTREAEASKEREEAFVAKQGHVHRKSAERVERVSTFRVEEREAALLKANLKPILQEQKKADKEKLKRDAKRKKIEKEEAKRQKDAAKAQKKVASKNSRNLSTALLALLTTKELDPLAESSGLSASDRRKVDEARSEAKHYEKCVAEELRDINELDQEYAVDTKERDEEKASLRKEYEGERAERMAEGEVEAQQAGDEAHEEATDTARDDLNVEDARIEKRRELHEIRNNANEAKLEAKYEAQKLAEDIVIANCTAQARRNEAAAAKAAKQRRDEETLASVEALLEAGKGLKIALLAALCSQSIERVMAGGKLDADETEEAQEELDRAKKFELRALAREQYLDKFDKELRDKFARQAAAEARRLEGLEKEQAAVLKKRADDMEKAQAEEGEIGKRLEGLEAKRSEAFAKEAAKLAKTSLANETRRGDELKTVEAEVERRAKEQEQAFLAVDDDLTANKDTGTPLSSGSLSILSAAQLQSISKGSQGKRLSDTDKVLVKSALVVAQKVEEMEAAEQVRRLERHERERANEAAAEARCEQRAEAASRRGEEKAARDAETRHFVAEQHARRTAETKIEADKRKKRTSELKAKHEQQEAKFQATVDDVNTPEQAAKGAGDASSSSYSFKPFKLLDVKDAAMAANRLGDLLADLSQEKALRIKLREEIDLQVERERAEGEHHRNLDDDEKKRRKRVQAREKSEAMGRAAAVRRESLCESRQTAAEAAEEKALVASIKKKEVFLSCDGEAEMKQGLTIAMRAACEAKKRPVIQAQPPIAAAAKKERKNAYIAKEAAFAEKKKSDRARAKEDFDKTLATGDEMRPSLLRRLGTKELKRVIDTKAIKDEKALLLAEQTLLKVEDDEKAELATLEKEFEDAEAAALAAESKAYGMQLAELDAPYVKADAEKDAAAAKRDRAAAESGHAEKVHVLCVKRVEFATKAKLRNVEQSKELREQQMQAMAEAKEQEKDEHAETLRVRTKQARDEKEMKRVRFEKAREIRERREKDAENMIQIDADLAGSQALDLSMLLVMGSNNLAELMQSGILDEKEQNAVEGEYRRAVEREAAERAWEEKVEREENEMIARKIRERESAIRREERRLLRNEAQQAKLERTLADTQRKEINAEENMCLKDNASTEAHSKYEELEQAKEQIEQEAAEMKLEAKEKQRLWVVEMRETARLEHEKKVEDKAESDQKRWALAKKQIGKLLEKQGKVKDVKKAAPLPEETLLMLGSAGLNELIEGNKLRLEADLIMAAHCRTAAEDDERNDRATMERWRHSTQVGAEMKAKAAEREVEVKANQMCLDATKVASNAREKWRRAETAAAKAKEKYEALCGKIEALNDAMAEKKLALKYKKELDEAAEKDESLDNDKIALCAKYKVPLGEKAAALVAEEEKNGKGQDKVVRDLATMRKRQAELEKQAAKAAAALEKANAALQAGEADIARLKEATKSDGTIKLGASV